MNARSRGKQGNGLKREPSRARHATCPLPLNRLTYNCQSQRGWCWRVRNKKQFGRISDDSLSTRSLISQWQLPISEFGETAFVLRSPHSIGYIIFALRATAIESSLPTVCFFSASFPTSVTIVQAAFKTATRNDLIRIIIAIKTKNHSKPDVVVCEA